MRIARINLVLIFSFILLYILCNSPLVAAIGGPLITKNTGWSIKGRDLYWTIDGGNTWHIITPQTTSTAHRIAAVFFKNTAEGWVLCCDTSVEPYKFILASSKDSGRTWNSTLINLALPPAPITNQNDDEYHPPMFLQYGDVFFLDSLHGWVLLPFYINPRTGLDSGILLRTQDGGKTWNKINPATPAGGGIRFLTEKDGWIAGLEGGDLHVTHDGGITWQEVVITPPPPPPSGVSEEDWDSTGLYRLPLFNDYENGFLPVTPVSGVLVLYATHNGGKTWKADRILSSVEGADKAIPSTMIDSTLITVSVSKLDRSISLIKVFPDNKIVTTKAFAFKVKGELKTSLFYSPLMLNFINIRHGWLLTDDQLLSTDDGGETWTVITPQ